MRFLTKSESKKEEQGDSTIRDKIAMMKPSIELTEELAYKQLSLKSDQMQPPQEIKGEISQNLWRLRTYLINRENDLHIELEEKNISYEQAREQAKKLQEEGKGIQYPYLDCEKRICDLVKGLWEKRTEIESQLLQESPRYSYFPDERISEQAIPQLLDYVVKLNPQPKLKPKKENDQEESGKSPIFDKQMTTMFLQLADSLFRPHAFKQSLFIDSRTASALLDIAGSFESIPLMRCCLQVCQKALPPQQQDHPSRIDPRRQNKTIDEIFLEPIAKLPFHFFPESKKPISDMLQNPIYKQDVVYQYEDTVDDQNCKKNLVIPYAEFADPAKPASKLNSEQFLKTFFQEKGFEKQLTQKELHQLRLRIIWQREIIDENSMHEGVLLWLIAMKNYNQIQACMQSVSNYNVTSLFEEAQDLMKKSAHPKICTEALTLVQQFITVPSHLKLHEMLGFDKNQFQQDNNADQDMERVQSSYLFSLAKKLSSINLSVSSEQKKQGQIQDVQMESPNEQKQQQNEPVEKSAFEEDVEMVEGSKNIDAVRSLQEFTASRTFDNEIDLINQATFLDTQVQLTLVNLYVKILDMWTSVGNRDERTPTDKWARAAVNLLRKQIQKILADGVVEHSQKCSFMKLHPLAYIKLMRSSFSDIYNQDQQEAFDKCQQTFISWYKTYSNGQVFYAAEKDSFELDQLYIAKLIKYTLRNISTATQSYQEMRLGSQAFPARLVDSQLIELIRTDVLSNKNTEWVNEFMVEIMQIVDKAINKEISLIKTWLKEPEQESSEEKKIDVEMQAWTENGLIPRLFDRIEKSVPNCVFLYNTFIDLMYHVSVPQDGIDFVKEKTSVLTSIYAAKIELPKIYRGNNRICFPDYAFSFDSHFEVTRKIPALLEHMTLHITSIKQKIKELSNQLVAAQNRLDTEQKDQRRTRNRDLSKRMLQTEHYEQLLYYTNIISGFCNLPGSSHMRLRDSEARLAQSVQGILVKSDEIEEFLIVFENNSMFKPLATVNQKLIRFFKLFMYEQESNFEKLKVLFERIKKVIASFETFIGKDLKDCPSYEDIIKNTEKITLPLNCGPSAILDRKKQLYWYIKIIDFYSACFKESSSIEQGHILGNEQFKKLGTYFGWEESIKTLLWFSRVLPQREGDLYRNLMLSDEKASLITKGRIKTGQDTIQEIRESYKSEIETDNFYSLVKQIYAHKTKIDVVFSLITEYNREDDGIRLNHSFDNKFLKLVHISACQLNTPPRQMISGRSHYEVIRGNLRQMGQGLAQIGEQIKLNLPPLTIKMGPDHMLPLTQQLKVLQENQYLVKQIAKWSKNLNTTVLVQFVAQDGLIYLCQYYLKLRENAKQINEVLKKNKQSKIQLTEEDRVLVRLCTQITWDSSVQIQSILESCMQQSKDAKLYSFCDVEQDSQPKGYSSLPHFFANHYNQMLTVLVQWTDTEQLSQMLLQPNIASKDDQDSEYQMEFLLMLLKEVAGNFPSCQMLKEEYVREHVQNPQAQAFFQGRNRNRDQEQQQAARPVRDPTEEEIEGVMSFVGYARDLVIPAIQMANFDLMTAQNLLLDDLPRIIAFQEEQRKIKAKIEEEKQQKEMEEAIKMSMQDDAENVEKFEVPTITLDDFKKRTSDFVTKMFQIILKGVRIGSLQGLKKESTLALTRTVLGCDLIKGVTEAEGESFQDNQRDALAQTSQIFLASSFQTLLDDAQQVEQCIMVASRMDFDLKFYFQLITLQGKLDIEKDSGKFIELLLSVTEHASQLLSATQSKINEKQQNEEELEKDLDEGADEAMKEERENKFTAFKNRIKTLVQIKLQTSNIISTSLQMLLMILVYVSKMKSSEVKKLEEQIVQLPKIENKPESAENKQESEENKSEMQEEEKEKQKELERQKKLESAQQRVERQEQINMMIAGQWFTNVNPQKILHVAMKLFEQTNTYIKHAASAKNSYKQNQVHATLPEKCRQRFDLIELMQSISDCSILIASQALSLSHWNYVKQQNYEVDGQMVDWQKQSALKFVIACLNVEKRNKMLEKIQDQLLAICIFEPSQSQEICNQIVKNALHCVAQRRAQKHYELESEKKENGEEVSSARALQLRGQLKAELSQYNYESFVKELKTILEWNPLNLQDQSLYNAITKSCVMKKKLDKNEKLLQLSEEEMKAISEDQNKHEAEIDRIIGSLEEIGSIASEQNNNAVQSRVDRLSELLQNLKKLTSESEVIALIQRQLGLNSDQSFSSQQNEEVKATELNKKEKVDSQFNILSRLSSFILVYPEITPSEQTLVQWIIQEFIPQLLWDKKVTVTWEKNESERNVQVVKNEFIPAVNFSENENKLCITLNKMTGMNRFMPQQNRVQRLMLRFKFLEAALQQLKGRQSLLSNNPSIELSQIYRTQVISALMVIKNLIFETNTSQTNRVIVNKDSYNKSVYFILLRGQKRSDNSQINFSNLVTDLILKSGKLIQESPEVKAEDQKVQKLDKSEQSQRILHGHITNLSISCMIDICYFIQEQGRKQLNEQDKEAQKGQKSRKRLNNSSVDQLMEEVKQEEIKDEQEPAQANAEAQENISMEVDDQQQQREENVEEPVQIQAQQQNQDLAINQEALEGEGSGEDDSADDNDQQEDLDENFQDVGGYDYQESEGEGQEDSGQDYGQELHMREDDEDDEEDLDEDDQYGEDDDLEDEDEEEDNPLMPHQLVFHHREQRGDQGRVRPGQQNDILNFRPDRQQPASDNRLLWDIGRQPERNNRQPNQQVNWTQEEQDIQRTIAMLQGERLNPDQNISALEPSRPLQRPPDFRDTSFLGYLQGRREEREIPDYREERKDGEDKYTKSIKELLEVFKPVPIEESLKMQQDILKNIDNQMRDARFKIDAEKNSESIYGMTIRSDHPSSQPTQESLARRQLHHDLQNQRLYESLEENIRMINQSLQRIESVERGDMRFLDNFPLGPSGFGGPIGYPHRHEREVPPQEPQRPPLQRFMRQLNEGNERLNRPDHFLTELTRQMEDRGLVQEEQKIEIPEEEKKDEAKPRVQPSDNLVPPDILPNFDNILSESAQAQNAPFNVPDNALPAQNIAEPARQRSSSQGEVQNQSQVPQISQQDQVQSELNQALQLSQESPVQAQAAQNQEVSSILVDQAPQEQPEQQPGDQNVPMSNATDNSGNVAMSLEAVPEQLQQQAEPGNVAMSAEPVQEQQLQQVEPENQSQPDQVMAETNAQAQSQPQQQEVSAFEEPDVVIQPQIAVEENKEEAKAEEVKEESKQEPGEEWTFGFPNALLIANDIEPSMLHELPEDMRTEILQPLQFQLQQHVAAQAQAQAQAAAAQQQQQNVQPVQEQQNQNQQNEEAKNENPNPIANGSEEQKHDGNAQALQPQLDERGFDLDFLAGLPEDVRREIEQNPQLAANNTQQNANANQPAQAQPGPLDVSVVIAQVQDPELRREMLGNLDEAQIDSLPANLRAEAMAIRDEQRQAQEQAQRVIYARMAALQQQEEDAAGARGGRHGGRAGNRPREGPLAEMERIYRMLDPGMFDNRAAREDKFSLDDAFNYAENHIAPEKDEPLYQKQAKAHEKQLATEDNLIESLLRILIQMSQTGSLQVSEKDKIARDSLENANTSELLLLMQNLCDMKANGNYLNRNRLTNAISMLLKQEIEGNPKFKNLILEKELLEEKEEQFQVEEQKQEEAMIIDTSATGIEKAKKEEEEKAVKSKKEAESRKRSDSIKLQLLLIGAVRLIVTQEDSRNKTFVIHLLKGMLFKDDYFKKKGQTVLKKQADLQAQSESEMIPPLVEFLSISDKIKDHMNNIEVSIMIEQDEVTKDSLRREQNQAKALHRNLNLLIVDVFKEFDQIIERVLTTTKKQKNLSVSPEAIISLTKLLNLQQVDKKLLSSLGKALVQIAKNDSTNWQLVHGQFQTTCHQALGQINTQLMEIAIKFKQVQGQVATTPSKEQVEKLEEEKEEPDLNMLQLRTSIESQLSENEQRMIRQESVTSDQGGKKLKLDQQQEEWFKQLISKGTDQLTSLKHIQTVYNQFWISIMEENMIMEKEQQEEEAQEKLAKEQEDKQAEEEKKVEPEINSSEKVEEEKKEGEEKVIEDKSKSKEKEELIEPPNDELEAEKPIDQRETQEAKEAREAKEAKEAQEAKEAKEAKQVKRNQDRERNSKIICEIREFQSSKNVVDHMRLTNEVLTIVQSTNLELQDGLIQNLVCIFESFVPDLNELMIEADKNSKQTEKKTEEIKIRPILQKQQQKNRMLGLFKNVTEINQRMEQFSVFCLNNKKAINKLLSSKNKSIDLKLADIVRYMPNLLDFDNKRAHFAKELERQKRQNRPPRDLSLSIKRDNIFQEAYNQLNSKRGNELRGKLRIRYSTEEGIDAGGLTRDFYIELSKAMFKPDYALFNLSNNGTTYYANDQSYVNPDHLNFFSFIGRMVGKAVFDGHLLECYFSKPLYKMMIGEDLQFEDMTDLDLDFYKNLKQCLEFDVEDLDLYFSATKEFFGNQEEIDLIPGGANILVTNDTKHDYVERLVFYKMYTSIKAQIDAFLRGFHELIPKDLVSIFNHRELELLIAGLPDFDIDDLKKHTDLSGYTWNSQQIIWLFEILEAMDKVEIGQFLQFVTGSSKIPPDGFKSLQGMSGQQNFTVARIRTKEMTRLPIGHTCFNLFDLPEYQTKEIMLERILYAIKETSGFGQA